jgi:predicted ribosomally synthesized peptide with SipW-like signal peptide
MNKIVKSLAVVAFVGAIAIGATSSYFSDTETSTGNTFTAGAIDLKVDSQQHYNNAVCVEGHWELENGQTATVPQYPVLQSACGGTWGQPTGKDIVDEKFFDFSDIKPGDSGENTVSLHVDTNEAYACVNIIPTKNDDVSLTEPEAGAGDVANTDSIFDGELAQNMTFHVWADICNQSTAFPGAVVGDNIYQQGCDLDLGTSAGPLAPVSYALATPTGNVFGGTGALLPGQTYYVGVGWSLPGSVGNIVQTDTYQADVSFKVEQSRNNPNFACTNISPVTGSLKLENENIVVGGPWTIIDDTIFANLTWTDNASTFSYSLTGKVPTPNANYSLIYYADGWPGNNPGAYIGTGLSDAGGNISFSGNPDLGMDLPKQPDGNYAAGAKIWLVLSADYNSGSLSTGPMTDWNPSQYLFEGNVYIHYNDTDVVN